MLASKASTSSKSFGLGGVADELRRRPLEPTSLRPAAYQERAFTLSSKPDDLKSRLIAVKTIADVRRLFRTTLVTIDTGATTARDR